MRYAESMEINFRRLIPTILVVVMFGAALLYQCTKPDTSVDPVRFPTQAYLVEDGEQPVGGEVEVEAWEAPRATVTPLPTPLGGLDIPAAERVMLACLVENTVRGMGESRMDAGLSLLSTVYARMQRHFLSDGTVENTLTWCEDGLCQFPGPFDCEIEEWAGLVVDAYAYGERGTCDGYLFADSRPGGPEACRVESGGQFLQFHDEW